jgi:hypothetical protein
MSNLFCRLLRNISVSVWRQVSVACLMAVWLPLSAGAVTIYNSIPVPPPPNNPSQPYQAQQTAEFGDLIQFAASQRTLTQVTLMMSDFNVRADWPSYPAAGWTHPLTLKLYNVDNSGPNPAPGSVIASRTISADIPWRAPADPTCVPNTSWRASDGLCYTALSFPVDFDFSGVTVPNQIIFGLSYNTQSWGANPIGMDGPWNRLNYTLANTPPTIGSLPFPDTAYWNTATAGLYTDGGAGGVGTFRRDTVWSPFSGMIRFAAADPPAALIPTLSPLILILLGLGMALLASMRLRPARPR